MRKLALIAAAALAVAGPGQAQPGTKEAPAGGDGAPGSNFTGKVSVSPRINGTGGSRLNAATVTFEAGARTNWHSHPIGQLLIVTKGEGWTQAEGQPVQTLRPGDIVWTPPGVKHWHGGTRTSGMTHVAVSETTPGATVTWLKAVTEAEFQGPR